MTGPFNIFSSIVLMIEKVKWSSLFTFSPLFADVSNFLKHSNNHVVIPHSCFNFISLVANGILNIISCSFLICIPSVCNSISFAHLIIKLLIFFFLALKCPIHFFFFFYFVVWSFILLSRSFADQMILILMGSNLSIFSFYWSCLLELNLGTPA